MKNRLYNSNNRAVVNEFGVVRHVTNYYPFGGVFSTTAYNHGDDLQPYKYNGKELDRTHGLDWYDYGARNYDATLPMWDRIDPLCEKYYHISPYAYCGNNPIKFIDPDGMRKWPVNKTYNGKKRRHENNYNQERVSKRTGKTYRHKGVDINLGAGSDDFGAPVYATHSGCVSIKGFEDGDGGGNRAWVTNTTSNGETISTGYFHMNNFTVSNGQWVDEGTQIGNIGNSAYGKLSKDKMAVHLHYEIKIDGKNINPTEDAETLIDPQQMISNAENMLPEIVITPEKKRKKRNE